MRISDWSSDVCSSDLIGAFAKLDDNTFTITFKEPYGLFPQRLASVYGVQISMMAKHYCSQFHPAYNEDGLDALMKEAEAQSRSEERRVGKEGVSTFRSRWPPSH